MKSANALLCVPRGDGELPAGQQLPAILIADLPPPSAVDCYHAKVVIKKRSRANAALLVCCENACNVEEEVGFASRCRVTTSLM